MSPLSALLLARVQLAWNAARRDAGVASLLAGAFVTLVTIVGLVVPAFMCFVVARRLGDDLTGPTVVILGGFLAVVVFVFGAVGGLRHRLHFAGAELRKFPVPGWQLLVAELPVGLLEVMPLVGASCLAGLGAGLVSLAPRAAVFVVPLVFQALLWLLLTQHVTGAIRRLALKRQGVRIGLLTVAAAIVIAVALVRTVGGGTSVLGSIAFLFPGTQALVGAGEWLDGALLLGALRQCVPLAFSAAFVAFASWLHVVETRTEAVERHGRGPAPLPWSGRRPRDGIAALFVRQVAGTRAGRLVLALPVIVAAIGAAGFLVLATRPTELSGPAAGLVARIPELPWIAVVCVAVPLFGDYLWTNQFGWDRGGIKTLLLLPIPARELLLGKLFGMARLFAVQIGLAALPLLLIHRPGWSELGYGLCAGATVLIVVGGLGHLLSLRYPRAVRGEGGAASLPAPLVVVQFATVLGIAALLGTVDTLGRLVPVTGGRLIAVAALLAVSGTIYALWWLPYVAARLARDAERLTGELG